MKTSFYQEEKELLNFYLHQQLSNPKSSFSYILHNLHNFNGPSSHRVEVELIVRPECNQQCEYCYIARYGKELFPIEERKNKEELLQNLRILLDYIYIEKEIYVNHWDLFAGDLFYDDIFYDIADIFYEYLSKVYDKYRAVMTKIPMDIVTPSNFSFVRDTSKIEKLQDYIDKFKKLNCELGFSISTDGPYASDTREGETLDEEYTNKLFDFMLKNLGCGMHPMISPSNVHVAIKNYNWFSENYARVFNDDNEENWHFPHLPMFLEVRNDEWSEDNINDLILLENHMIKDRLKWCNNDIDLLAYHLFGPFEPFNKFTRLRYNDIIALYFKSDALGYQKISCSMQELLHISLNNLSFPICHRLTYKQFQGGKFIVENNKIIDIEPINPSIFLTLKTYPMDKHPRCIDCPYLQVCLQGCLGAQFESSGEILIPCNSVCNMKIAKIKNLVTQYYEMGVFQSAYNQGYLTNWQIDIINNLLKFCQIKGEIVKKCQN